MNYKIYKYTFPNGKVYIGKTKTSLEQRAGSNGCRYGLNTLVGQAIHQFGWENIEKDILYFDLDAKEANKKEREVIAIYKSTDRNFGYNLTRGGDGGKAVGSKLSDETKRKIGLKNSIKLKGRKLPQEQIERMRQALIGHEVSEETREKIRKANTGKHHSEETKQKISQIVKNRGEDVKQRIKESLHKTQAQRTAKRLETMKIKYPDGFKQSAESNEKRSIALKGKCKSEETKQKMRKPKSPEAIENMRKAQREAWKRRKQNEL